MNDRMPKSQAQLERLQNEKLEAAAGGLDALVKNSSLQGKVAKWAAVAVSFAGIFVGMGMPAQALHRVPDDLCIKDRGFLSIWQGPASYQRPTMCFAKAGDQKVVIANVYTFFSGNNAGYIFTNKGTYRFRKHQEIDFPTHSMAKGTVTILRIKVH